MSLVMLKGVLKMPPALWSGDPVDVNQRHARYVEAANKLQAIEDLVTADQESQLQFIARVRAVLES